MRPNELGGKTFEGPDDILPLTWALEDRHGYLPKLVSTILEYSSWPLDHRSELVLGPIEVDQAIHELETYSKKTLPLRKRVSLTKRARLERRHFNLHRKAASEVLK